MRVNTALRCDNCSTEKFPLMKSGAKKVYIFHPRHGDRQHACSTDCHQALYTRWTLAITAHWRNVSRPPDALGEKARSLDRGIHLVAL
jgi:hypothetical protein